MGKFTKYLCLSLLFIFFFVVVCAADELHFKGNYFIFSAEKDFIYGSGKIVLKSKNTLIKGDVLYMDVKLLQGVIYGNVRVKTGLEEKTCHALFFTAFPMQLLYENFLDNISKDGNKDLNDILIKHAPETLKKTDLFFEFREFRIDKYRRIKAKTIIPYIMGLPTIPIKSFIVRRGETPDKTAIFFKNLNFSDLEGLSASFILRLKKKFVKGDFDLRLFEKELLGLDNPKRGFLFSGSSDFFAKDKSILNFSALLNSGDESYNFSVNHRKDLKNFAYFLSQSLSGRGKTPSFLQFAANVTLKKILFLSPTFSFSHNLKKSYSYGISTPLKVWGKLGLNLRWNRKILKENFVSDMSDISTSLNFNSAIFSLSSNYNFSKNMPDAAGRQNFSLNMRFNPVHFLNKNISLTISSFYMFSSFPSGDESMTRSTPGINVTLQSAGALLPFGFKLAPSFTLNHIWDNQDDDYTDFNSQLSIAKEMGKFNFSLAYALVSRYRSKNFWVEGNNMQNMSINLELLDADKYSFYLRFYYNNDFNLENISLSGKIHLPYNFILSSFVLYYNDENKFRTVEVFLEKKILHNAKLQGGYSLALKKIFIQVVSI